MKSAVCRDSGLSVTRPFKVGFCLIGGVASIQIPATTLSLGSDTLTVTYTPDPAGSVLYQGGTGTATVTVTKTTPTITWAAPSAITYGTPLSGTQLNATASTNGTFSYNPATRVVLSAVPQTLMVTFTPADTTNYQIATSTVPLTVNTAPLSISANSVSRAYGVCEPIILRHDELNGKWRHIHRKLLNHRNSFERAWYVCDPACERSQFG